MSDEPMALLAIAEEAARAAADELLQRFGSRQNALRSKSTPTDPVSEADLAAEAAIRAVLHEQRPGDSILGEEGGATDGSATRADATDGSCVGAGPLRWVVDPLDGTVNFLFGIPQFAVSIACEDADGALVGVVLDPVRGECFSAVRGGPAMVSGSPVTVSTQPTLAGALVATGFGYDPDVRARQAAVLATVLPIARDVRRAGAAALDLAWCACGRLDAYYERGVKHWDVAAGSLIAQRAGLLVRSLAAADGLPDGVVVGPPGLIDELYALVS
ncbi:MAG: inositol monophosphatase family protein [Solirubrobacteraceae bacterium]